MKLGQRLQIVVLVAVIPVAMWVAAATSGKGAGALPATAGRSVEGTAITPGELFRGDIFTPLERERLQMTPQRR